MAYQTITATNADIQCGIQIQCVATAEAVADVDAVVLKKRFADTGAWKIIDTITILSVADYNFKYLDADTRSGCTYQYAAIPVKDGAELVGVTATCKCAFGGVLVGDSTGTFVSLYNNEYSMQKNTQVAYVSTLSGRYPRRVSNAATNYMSGSVTGLFLPYNEKGYPVKSKAREYKDMVLEMLCNGKPKLLKTYDGNMWIVSINESPKEDFSLFDGASTITFEWTEIGKMDSSVTNNTYLPESVDTPPKTLTNGGLVVTA